MAVKRKRKENVIEAELKKRVEELGGVCLKVTVIGQRGFFDRLVMLPGGLTIFCECKRPSGGRFSPHQIWYAATFKKLGARVANVRNRADIDRLLSSSPCNDSREPRRLARVAAPSSQRRPKTSKVPP